MSTPTSREPDERPADATPGQHAAPRPVPPVPEPSSEPAGPPAPSVDGGRSTQPPPPAFDTPSRPYADPDHAGPSGTGEARPERTSVLPVTDGPTSSSAGATSPDVDRPPHPPVPPPASATHGTPASTTHDVHAAAPAAGAAGAVAGASAAEVAARGDHASDRPVDAPVERTREVEERELPERPKKPGFGRHLLGTLLGLLLTPVALLLTGIGTARLADVAGSGDPLTDALGLTLLAVGVLLLAVIVLLGAWSPAVPIAGGLVWGIGLGVAFLVVPRVMEDTLESMSADRVVPGGIEQLAESAQSGHLLVTGTLLVAAGIAAARARRRGRRFAEDVAAHDAARVQVRDGRRTA